MNKHDFINLIYQYNDIKNTKILKNIKEDLMNGFDIYKTIEYNNEIISIYDLLFFKTKQDIDVLNLIKSTLFNIENSKKVF